MLVADLRYILVEEEKKRKERKRKEKKRKEKKRKEKHGYIACLLLCCRRKAKHRKK